MCSKKNIFIAIICIVFAVCFYKIIKPKAILPKQSNNFEYKKDNKILFEAINGMKVEEKISLRRPVAVVIENHPDARPQSGLFEADVVYEALAEGGITRFLAVFQTQSAKNFGPIRSARTYFAELSNEINSVFVHVGGNSDALSNIQEKKYTKLTDVDQFFNDAYFHRISSRLPPHNVYSSIEKIDEFSNFHFLKKEASYSPWKFKQDLAGTSSMVSSLEINFSLPDFKVLWVYDNVSNGYKRWLAGKSHLDKESSKQIQAKNIVVQFVKTFPVESDTPLSIGMDLKNGGDAMIFLDGKEAIATWKVLNGRTRYFLTDGHEISLNRGSIWVELVPDTKKLAVVWK